MNLKGTMLMPTRPPDTAGGSRKGGFEESAQHADEIGTPSRWETGGRLQRDGVLAPTLEASR
jgi:hypothetical protein